MITDKSSRTAQNAASVIKNGKYADKESMMDMLDIFLLGNRITKEEYNDLVELLNDKESTKV